MSDTVVFNGSEQTLDSSLVVVDEVSFQNQLSYGEKVSGKQIVSTTLTVPLLNIASPKGIKLDTTATAMTVTIAGGTAIPFQTMTLLAASSIGTPIVLSGAGTVTYEVWGD